MSKRGERQPWRVVFIWPHPHEQPTGKPIRGVETFTSRGPAEALVATLRRRSNAIRVPITITLEHRDLPETKVEIAHAPQPEEI